MTIGWVYFFTDGMIFEIKDRLNLKVFSHLENKPTGHSLKRNGKMKSSE